MRGEEQRIFVPLLGRPFFSPGYCRDILGKAEVIALDLRRGAKKPRPKAPRECRLTDALRPGEQQRLRNTLVLDHPVESRGYVPVAPEIFKQTRSPPSRPARLRAPHSRSRPGCGSAQALPPRAPYTRRAPSRRKRLAPVPCDPRD